MDKIKHNIKLDLADGGSQDAVYVRQNDTAAHVLIFHLRTNGKTYRIADDVVARIYSVREDGSKLYNACTIEDNTIRTEITTDTIAVAGRVECVLELIGTEPAVLTTPGFDIIVEHVDGMEGIEGTNEFSALVQQTAETKALQMEIEQKLENGEFNGEDGYSPEVTVTPIEDGYRLTVKNKETEYSADIIAPEQGEQGVGIESAVLNADYTLTLNFTDGSSYTTPSIRGEKGEPGIGLPGVPGKDGDDGVSPKVSVAQITNGQRITIEDAYGTKSFDLLNGSKGDPGNDGVTPEFTIGTVTTLEAGQNATASIGGTAEKPVLNLGIPKGRDGKDGEDAEGGSGGTTDHAELTNRDAANQHPMGAISGLEDALADKQPIGDYALKNEIPKTAEEVNALPDTTEIPAALADLDEDANHRVVTDKQIEEWNSKSDFSGDYGDLKNIPEAPVTSVNGMTGTVKLDAAAVGARADTWMPTPEQVGADPAGTATAAVGRHNTDNDAHEDIRLLVQNLTARLNALANSEDVDLDQMAELVEYIKDNRELIEQITTNKVNVSDIINNLTTNVSNKPLSAAQGVALKVLIDAITVPTKLSDLSTDSTHRTVTDAQISVWNGKSDFSGNYNDLTNKPAIPTVPTVVQEAGESETLVMSQKAVTDLVNDALGDTSASYETVDSVDDMTDTSKSYVLSTTGTIWTYGEVTTTVEPPNKFVPSTATLNQRLSGSSGSVSGSYPGALVTDFIAVSDLADISPYNVRLNWEMQSSDDNKVVWFNSSKTRLHNTVYLPNGSGVGWTASNGETVLDLKYVYSGTAPSWSDVAYVRFMLYVKPVGTSITSADIADLSITFDHEGGTKIEKAWYDTGMTPSTGGGGGGNIVDLLVKVNENKANIAELDSRVIALETDADTLTVPSFWQNAVDACIAKIKALQIGRNCITFPFFSDNHQRNGYSGLLISYIMKECNIPYAFFGGDSIDSGYIASEAVMIAQDKAFDTAMSYIPNGRFCRAVGNHDGYWYDGTNKFYYTREQVYELFLREESIAQNKHFGEDGTYYYIDDIASKVRFVVLDTNGGSMDATQLAWMQNTALSFNESGWAVVFISHQPISNHYHALISNAAEVRTVVQNYISGSSANKAAVVGWYSGHIHRDRIYTGAATNTTDDAQGTAMGFTQVTITSDHTGIAYEDATKHTVANDDKSHAIDFVTVNKTTRTVNLTRLGIGNDRSYTY